MIATGLFRRRRRFGHVEPGDQCDAIPEWLKRLRDEGEVEVLAFLQRTPVARSCAVRMPDAKEARNRRGGGLVQRSLRGNHAVEQRQADHYTCALEKRTARNELL